jgi:ABC-type uncharacterized transport system substrate-binding protein
MAKLARHDENAILIRAPEPALKAAIATTRSVPLVIVAVSYDPLASGYINSLAHPGGNVTGVFLENVELAAKRIDLLKQAAPKTARLVVLYDAAGKYQLDPLQSTSTGRRKPGLQRIQRVPSSDIPPPGTIIWTCGWWVIAEPQL